MRLRRSEGGQLPGERSFSFTLDGGRLSSLMSRALLLFGCVLLAACTPDPVKWDSERRSDTPVPAGSRLTLQGGDLPAMAAAWTPPRLPSGTPRCAGSLVAAPARGDTAFAAWWAPRADSSALLVVARSDDGGLNWRHPEVADSTDKGRTGCARPAPFIAADTTNGYVHVVYFMVAAEGPGVFFTHSMGRGVMFHSPVPVVYGGTRVGGGRGLQRRHGGGRVSRSELRAAAALARALADDGTHLRVADGGLAVHGATGQRSR